MKPKTLQNPEYFHKVVDCQYACPAHTPVPEYIRLIAAQRFSDAYMVNWQSNVFPGILGRTCDRPCEPACRRGRVDEDPVAICRLKRVAADKKGDIQALMPPIPKEKNGKKVALIGAGPASLTVARDLMPLGYEIDLFDENPLAGGMMRSQIPSFRLPSEVIDEEVNYVLNMGITRHFETRINSLKALLTQPYDAIFVGTGAPKGMDLDLPGRDEVDAQVHVGIQWLANVSFEHTKKISKRVLVLGGGNTAMDCCRTARRLGGEEVTVVVRSEREKMKASAWEIEDALAEDIPILNNLVPKAFIHNEGHLIAMEFTAVEAVYDDLGHRHLVPTNDAPVVLPCDEVLIAIGQHNSFPWIEKDLGISFDDKGMVILDKTTFQSTNEKVFFGGDAGLGPTNIITAVAHGHQAAISIDLHCQKKDVHERPDPTFTLVSQKMGIHEWSYDSIVSHDQRYTVPQVAKVQALQDRKLEVELCFNEISSLNEAQRCLNCDVQTVFTESKCIECDACMDICPTDCINFIEPIHEETAIRKQLKAPAEDHTQAIFISDALATQNIMVKDENVCLHCGLCAERCPTGAWDMQRFFYNVTQAGKACKRV